MDAQDADWDAVLGRLQSEEGRAAAAREILQAGGKVSPGLVEKAIQTLQAARRLEEAGELAEGSGNSQKAFELYLEAGMPARAVKAAMRGEDPLEAICFLSWRAAKLGLYERLVRVFEEAGLYGEAARLAEKLGEGKVGSTYFGRAAGLYEKAGDFRGAWDTAQFKAKDREAAEGICQRGIRAYEEAGQLAKLAEMLYPAGEMAREREGDEAARPLWERSLRYFEIAWEFSEAAALANKLGDLPRAVRNYERGGLFRKAAELSDQLGDRERAEAYRILAWVTP